MKSYELLYIIPATYAENEIQPVIDEITKELTKLEAKIIRNDMVGKLKLAYPVKKVRHGYYILVDLEIDPDKLAALNKAFRLHSEVIRHQLVVKNKKSKPIFKITSLEEVEREKALARSGRETGRRQTAAAPKTETKKVEVDMAEVEKKLDNILEGKIL